MIAIVNYGLGNIKAIANVYKKLNIPYCFASTVEQLEKADKIILPGVGAFDHAMLMLNNSGLRDALDFMVLDRGLPVLGVCVGMHMMADASEEGVLEGLGWIPGKVKRFSFANLSFSEKHPLPHMGWNNVALKRGTSLYEELGENSRFYFLHSYYFECTRDDASLASTEYGFKFSCIVNRKNIYGIQCHPEKSHSSGVRFLKYFSGI